MTDLTFKKIKSARQLAFDALYQIFEKEAYANLAVQEILRQFPLIKEEKKLLTELVYGVCRRYNYLLWIIEQLSTRSIKKLHPTVRILLCIALYQLIYLDRIPESAAVNETVKVSKKITHVGNSRFINGILRNFLRKKNQIVLPMKNENPISYYSLKYNVPEWLVRYWAESWGISRTERILAAFQVQPLMCIRVNTLKMSAEDLKKRLSDEKISFETVPYTRDAFIIKQRADLIFGDLLQNGLIYIQSISSMMPAIILEARPQEKILDMCAAPGSKTTYLASFMENRGTIDAWDIYPHKINLIRENAKRLGISIIHAEAKDSTLAYPALYNTYDRVLLDAPCSGLGVISHKPEIKWRRSEADLMEFPKIQKKLLENASRYIKKDGILVYSTCTLNKKENENIIEEFLSSHPGFVSVDFSIPAAGESKNGMMTLWPDQFGSDGFFLAKLRKVYNET